RIRSDARAGAVARVALRAGIAVVAGRAGWARQVGRAVIGDAVAEGVELALGRVGGLEATALLERAVRDDASRERVAGEAGAVRRDAGVAGGEIGATLVAAARHAGRLAGRVGAAARLAAEDVAARETARRAGHAAQRGELEVGRAVVV